MKYSIFLLFLLSICILCSSQTVDISWEHPELTSGSHDSFLKETNDAVVIFPEKYFESRVSQTYFALNSWSQFKSALRNFCTSQTDDSSIISYHSPGMQSLQSAKSALNSLPPRSSINLSLYTGIDLVSNTDENYYFVHYGSRFSGSIDDKLFFFADWWAGHFAGDQDFYYSSKLIDSWSKLSDDSTQVYLDSATGRIQYNIQPYWDVAVGRGKYEIGNNIGGSLILHDACNEYGYFSTNLDFSKFYVHFIHASLVADSTFSSTKSFPDKYLAIHKFGWKPNDNFELFWGEHVVYGNRGIELSYLVPTTFWRWTEHNLADRDNVLMFAGMNWHPCSSDLVYGNCVLDEFSAGKVFKNWWGNKYGIQVGNSYRFSEQKKDRITLEFTAIRPWLYTHNYLQNKFSHDDIGLGFPDGSNLIQYACEWNYEALKNLDLNLHASYTRQGSVGNDFSINYDTRDKALDEKTHWLQGDITDTISAKAVVDWAFLAHHKVKLAVILSQIDDADWEKEITFGYQARY
ncbi:MAG TPA: hypothetical protein PLD62_07235 [Candidatus Cloacimonadota bacterium]|nr:hypothetical protein [Candidatus Cloacimonadota bacterium]